MEQFGKYQLIRRIGSGGMAEVFLARTMVAQGLAKQLVIKKIHPAFARSRQFMSMFVDEAKIALGLNHPNIVQVFDFGQVGETFFLAMEYVEGLDLLRVMHECKKRKEPIPLGLCAYIVQQVAKGLDYAHRKADEFGEPLGIVHRDISPQNVLVSWDGAVKIVDFGIARARDVHEEEGVVKGKFAYMAPEQARGEPVDRRADVFSAGVVLFEICTGRPLFPGKGRQVLEKVKAGAVPSPRKLNPEIPRELEETILKALTFHRDDRFQTGRDLQHALGRFQFQYAAKDAGVMQDSGALARFLANTVQRRQGSRRPPTAPPVGERQARPGSGGSSEVALALSPDAPLSGTTPMPERGSESRQRKHVFVLEGQICGLSKLEERVGSGRAKRVVKGFFDIARDIAYKHDAVVHRIGELGFSFVVGLPVAGEDDASRTIRLAMALVETLDGIGHDVDPELRLAVGIQRGVAILKSRRGARLQYDLGAATTAIARRLAAEAHGADVLCGGAVYRVAHGDWNFEELATIDLPMLPDTQTDAGDADSTVGKKSARVYRLRGPKERQQRIRERSVVEDDLIGRDLELKSMRDAYRDVLLSGRKRYVLVVGEAGVGKRALVSALLKTIPGDEAVVLRAAARANSSYSPFGMIADLARDLHGLAEGADPREVQRRLEMTARVIYPGEGREDEVRGLVEAAGALLGTGESSGRALDAAERRQRILRAVIKVQSRFQSDRPMVIVGEDVQWADEESMELFTHLLENTTDRGVLGIVTARPTKAVFEIADKAGADVIRLGELSEQDRLALVTRRFVPGEDARELARQVVSRTGGNPFFIREMVDALVDRGILVPEPDESKDAGLLRWVRRDAPIQVPTSVEALLATRIDRLPEEEKTALIHAAVLGRRFAIRPAEELLGSGVHDMLARLCERGLMRKDGQSYAFVNELTMTVAYQLLPNEERSALHQAVAERLANSARYRPGRDDAVIARHLELAGADEKAAERYLLAATHAIDVGGNSDAFRQLTRALRLLPADDHERRFTARRQREEILRRLARRPAQLKEIQTLLKEAEALDDPARLALAHSRLAQYYIDVGDAESAAEAAAPALEKARESGDRLAEAEALRLRASVARLTGDSEEALRVTDEALELCGEEREHLYQRATILNNRGTTLWNMSRLREASEAYAEALVIYQNLKLPRLEARTLNNMGVVFSALGEVEVALAHYKSSLKLDQKLGDRASIALKLGNIGQSYADLGDLERGARYLKKALALTEETSDKRSMVDILISLGQVQLSHGANERAIEHFERGLSLARENRDRYQEIRALCYLSMAQTRAGRAPEESLALARQATEQARRMPMPVGEIYGLAAQGLALAELGRPTEGADLTARAVELQRANEQPEGAEEILYVHAVLCEKAGRVEEARQALREGRVEVERKAQSLSDEGLRRSYRAARIPSGIDRAYRRLVER